MNNFESRAAEIEAEADEIKVDEIDAADFETRVAKMEAEEHQRSDLPVMQMCAGAVLLQTKSRWLIADMMNRIRELEGRAHG